MVRPESNVAGSPDAGAAKKDLLRRHRANPILTAELWPRPVSAVLNPGAVKLDNGDTLLLCRVEERNGLSQLWVARSSDGLADWQIEPEPALSFDPTKDDEIWGLEDARVVWIEELSQYGVVYTSYGRHGPGVSLALTKDFKQFERFGQVLRPEDKDAALLPRRIDGRWAMIHRPATGSGSKHLWMSFSSDLMHWGESKLVIKSRLGGWWDAGKIGLCAPLVETTKGWLMFYHGVRETVCGSIYRVGLALLDLDDPTKCISRGQDWIMGPQTPYERVGDVPNVVFPSGCTMAEDGDALNLYYGAADTCIALASTSIRELFAWLEEHGGPVELGTT